MQTSAAAENHCKALVISNPKPPPPTLTDYNRSVRVILGTRATKKKDAITFLIHSYGIKPESPSKNRTIACAVPSGHTCG